MKKFEIGKRYGTLQGSYAVVYEIVSRTEKRVKFCRVQHSGRFNEKKSEIESARVRNWDTREVFITGYNTIDANEAEN